MSIDLGRRLIAAGLVSPEEVEAALFLSVAKGVPFPRVLIDRGAVSERVLEEELERLGGLALRQVAGAADLWGRLPRAMCRRLAALPTRVDPATGAVDVAAADPLDTHVATELGFHLGMPIRILRAPIAVVEEAIRRLELDDPELRAGAPPPDRGIRPRRVTPPFPHGAPQSSIPPPVLDETPIPLVRKSPAGSEPTPPRGSAPPQRAGGTLVPPQGAPPLARLGVPAPRAPAIPSSPPTRPYGNLDGEPEPEWRAAPRGRGVRIAGPPAVSFPSTPPGDGDRHTPPYGTPAYDPLTLGIRPPQDSYPLGLAPPEEPLPPPRPSSDPDDEPPPPSAHGARRRTTTLPSSAFSAPADASPDPAPPPLAARRPPRPSLGEVPYPAAIPSQPSVSRRSSRPPAPPIDDEPAPLAPVPRRVRAPEGAPVLESLEHATSRDEVIRVALRGMRLVAHRLAIFAVKRDGFYGWACNVEFGDADLLRDQKVPIGQPSILATASATAIYLGPVPATPAHEGLLRVMERASSDVAAVAVRVAGRPALVLVCDELDDTMVGTRFLVELAKAVGEALARLIVR